MPRGRYLQSAKLLLLAACVIAFATVHAFTFHVKPDELGVVTRFGRIDHQEGPELHFRMPYPIEEVLLPKATRQNIVEIGMRSDPYAPGAARPAFLTSGPRQRPRKAESDGGWLACIKDRVIRRVIAATLLFWLAALAYVWPEPAEAADTTLPASITVTVALDAAGVEKGLTGTHVLQMRSVARSKAGEVQMSVGCVPCFNIFLSFAFTNGRLYAMNWQTDSRRGRYHAVVDGKTVAIEVMNGLRARDWLDAFGGVDQLSGCSRSLAKGKDLEAVVRRGICITP